MIETIWFCAVAATLAMYVVLDGFDLGVGALHLVVAKDMTERKAALRSIGPVWDGNEVWLIAAGGTLLFAFPVLYASSFSGFYLPLMIVLWLLILRGVALEFRNHLEGPVWVPFWDAVFSGASLLLVVFFGAALGNVVRGVPLDAQGRFFEPLWTDLRVGPAPGILDWYTILAGLTALAALGLHGALWLHLKTRGDLERRSARAAVRAWAVTGLLTLLLTAATLAVQPLVGRNLAGKPWGWLLPLAAVAGWAGARWFLARRRALRAFLSSCLYLAGMLGSAAFGIYPYVLPSIGDPALGLTAPGTAAPAHGLWLALAWWIPGMLLVAGYFAFTYRRLAGKVETEGEGY